MGAILSIRFFFFLLFSQFFISFQVNSLTIFSNRRQAIREKCPQVKGIRNFDITLMMGKWFVVQYYASSEEIPEYSCMRSIFSMSDEGKHVTMNFTYIFSDDLYREQQQGNITWKIPNFDQPAHWIHNEETYEPYNTYILDTDYQSWALIMHCAEKDKSPRYLSALLLSRNTTLSSNVVNFLREKLPRYDIDISFMFDIPQNDCEFNTTANTMDQIYKLRYESVNDNNANNNNQNDKIINLSSKLKSLLNDSN